jgi:hypothetical protein
VNANRLCHDRNFARVAGRNNSTFDYSQSLPRCYLGIAYQRIQEFSGSQRAIGLITPVGKRFCGGPKAGFTKYIQHGRTCQSYEHNVAAPSRDACGDCLREFAITDRLVVKRAMRLYVHHLGTTNLRSFRQGPNLREHGFGNFVWR